MPPDVSSTIVRIGRAAIGQQRVADPRDHVMMGGATVSIDMNSVRSLR